MKTKTASELALELCYAIEAAGASERLTACSLLASELRLRVVELESDQMSRANAAFSTEAAAIRMRIEKAGAVGGLQNVRDEPRGQNTNKLSP